MVLTSVLRVGRRRRRWPSLRSCPRCSAEPLQRGPSRQGVGFRPLDRSLRRGRPGTARVRPEARDFEAPPDSSRGVRIRVTRTISGRGRRADPGAQNQGRGSRKGPGHGGTAAPAARGSRRVARRTCAP